MGTTCRNLEMCNGPWHPVSEASHPRRTRPHWVRWAGVYTVWLACVSVLILLHFHFQDPNQNLHLILFHLPPLCPHHFPHLFPQHPHPPLRYLRQHPHLFHFLSLPHLHPNYPGRILSKESIHEGLGLTQHKDIKTDLCTRKQISQLLTSESLSAISSSDSSSEDSVRGENTQP